MWYRVAMERAFWWAMVWVVMTCSPVGAHPGAMAEDGCHVCRTDCESWGLDDGERHCHEEVSEARWARQTVWVERVVDGDTLKVRTRGEEPVKFTVRFRGIDCPEMNEGGGRAKRHVQRRLTGKTVVLQAGMSTFERDRYGRTLAYVERVGVDIGLELIEAGLCVDYSQRYPHARQTRYLAAQALHVR